MSVKYGKITVCNGYFLDKTVLNQVSPDKMYSVVEQSKTELSDFIKSKKDTVKKVKKMNNKAYALLSDKNLRKHIFDLTKDTENFDDKNNLINEELKKFAGYGFILTSYDFWNVNSDLQVAKAKESLKYLKDLKVKKQSKTVTVEDMLKDLKISSD